MLVLVKPVPNDGAISTATSVSLFADGVSTGVNDCATPDPVEAVTALFQLCLPVHVGTKVWSTENVFPVKFKPVPD